MSLFCWIGRKVPALFPVLLLVSLIYSQALAASDSTTFNFAVFGNKSVSMSGGYADSYQGSPSSHVKGQYAAGDVGTNSLQSCAIQMSGGAVVYGQGLVGYGANPAAGICLSGGSSIYNNNEGTLTTAKDMTPKTDPGDGTVMGTLNLSGSTRTISTGTYRYSSVTLSGGSTLTVDGEVTLYVEGNLTLSGGSRIVIASGPVTIYVSGQKLDISGGSVVNNSHDPKQMTIYGVTGLQTANISSGSTQYLRIFAPAAAITLSGGHETFGSVIGNTVTLSGGSSVHFQERTDVVPPVISVTSPADGSLFKTADITVTGSVDEAVSSVTVNGASAVVSGTDFSLAGVHLLERGNTLEVRATDLAGNVGTATVVVTLDTIPPGAPVLAPVTSPTNVATITLGGSSEAGSSVKIFSGPTLVGTVSADSQGSFALANASLVPGKNTFTATAIDAAGNESVASTPQIVVLDQEQPKLAVSTLPDGSYTNNATLNITGNAEDGVGVRELRISGEVVPVNPDGSFSHALTLNNGSNKIEVSLTDLAGNQTKDTRSVILDQAGPVLTITSPADNSKTKEAVLQVTGQVDKQATIQVKVNNIPYTPVMDGLNFTATVTPVYGYNTIEVSALDLAGNPGTAKRTVIFDDRNPSLAVTDPGEDLRTNKSSITVSGTAGDDLATVTISVSNGTDTFAPSLVNGAFEQVLPLTEEKTYAVTVTATNELSNSTRVQRNIIFDITPPAVTINPVTTPTNQSSQVIVGTREANAAVNVTCATANVGGVSYPTATTWSVPLSLFSADLNIVNVSATDAAGNVGSTSADIVYDVTAPTGTISVNNGSQETGSTDVQLGVTSSDASGVSQMRFSTDGITWSEPTPYVTTTPLTLAPGDGSKQVYVQFMDLAGNWSAATSVGIVLDTTPPVVTASPAGGTFSAAEKITLTANEQATIYYTTDGTTPTESSPVYSQPISIPATATLSFFAKDSAGNPSQPRSETYIIDTIPPTVTVAAPTAGMLTKNPNVAVRGTVSEENCTVTVNGAPAVVTGTSFALADYTLAEGANTLTMQALDKAGNPGSASVTVTLDSTPPVAPVLTAMKSPTNVAAVMVGGTAEPGSAVKVMAGANVLASVDTDASGKFAIAEVKLAEGINTFTATATDAAGNVSAASAEVSALLDTKPPVITVTVPSDNSFTNLPLLTVKGRVDDATATVTVNGLQATQNGTDFERGITLNQGLNVVTVTATDPAGNSATTTLSATLDIVPPTVAISSPVPGMITNTPGITVTGTISKVETTATVNNSRIDVSGQAFSASYILAEGDNTITVQAVDKAGNTGSAAVDVVLDTQAPQLSLAAPSEASAGSNVNIELNGSDNRGLTLVELKADGVPIWSGSNAPSVSQSLSYTLSPALNAGSQVFLQARGVDAAGNEGTASAVIKIGQAAMGPGYLQGKVLDDSRGLRMSGAAVTVTDGKGISTSFTTAEDGGYFTEAASGNVLVQVSKPGYTGVERVVTVLPEKNSAAPDARLTPLSTEQHPLDGNGGTVKVLLAPKSTLAVELNLPTGSLAVQGDLRVTPLGNQGMAGILPAGWSPLAAADIRLLDPSSGSAVEATFGAGASIKFPLPAPFVLPADAVVTLASYDTSSHRWITKGSVTVAADGTSVSAAIPGTGSYALVIADPAPNAPPVAAVGAPLQAATSVSLDFDATAAWGKVVPQASPPSVGLKAAGEVVLTAADGAAPVPQLISGLVVNSRITESFNLSSGDEIDTPVYTQDIILYRAPCVTSIGGGSLSEVTGEALRTTFPVSPSKEFTIVDLLMGKVGIEIVEPEATDTGVMVGADGARLVDADGNMLVVPAGALTQATPVSTKSGSVASVVVGNDFTLLKAVEVNLTRQTLAASATLFIPVPAGVNPSLPLLVAKGVDVKGVTRLKLVAVARITGSFIGSDGSVAGVTLPGITVSGTYYFLQARSPIGFVGGIVTDSSAAPFTGALVKTDTGSLIDLSNSAGKFLLAAPVTAFTATAMDLYKGDDGSSAGAITAASQVLALDLAIRIVPPRVVSITPAANAANVQPSDPVVVTFSKGMDRASINSSTLKVADSTGSPIQGVISFNVDGTAATFYPAAVLQPEWHYSITVSGTVKDLQGHTLGQDLASGFAVRKTTPPTMPTAGAISGTFPDADGFVTITATQGSADPMDTVMLVNDSTGEIVSFSPATDGSFTNKIRGQVGDQIKVVLMDHSGNQTTISYLTYRSDDGKYFVTSKGGMVAGDGGSLLQIPDGALIGPTIVKLTTVPESSLSTPVPVGGKFLGAVSLDTGGINLEKAVEISMPVPANMPDGVVPFLAQPQLLVNADGATEQVYVIIDSARVVNGRITTACPPFDGVQTAGTFAFVYAEGVAGEDVTVAGYAYQDMDGQPGYTPGVDLPIRGAVIRAPGAENFVSFTNATGHYATYGFTQPGACRNFPLTATHPQTMNRVSATVSTCQSPYIVNNFNFRLADKATIPPDHTPPYIDFKLALASGQSPGVKLSDGITSVGAILQLPITITDQSMQAGTSSTGSPTGVARLTVEFDPMDGSKPVTTEVRLTQIGSGLKSAATGNTPAIFGYVYQPAFSAPLAGKNPTLFQPGQAGFYNLTVTATDFAGNSSSKTVSLRIFSPGEMPTAIDGPPFVVSVAPGDGSTGIRVDTDVSVYFSEMVSGVDERSFILTDVTDEIRPRSVPATVSFGLDSGLVKARLVPTQSLSFGHTYQVDLVPAVLATDVTWSSPGIMDMSPNASSGGALLPLVKEIPTRFTTIQPTAYGLASGNFTGGWDIAFYTDRKSSRSFTYVTALDKGWWATDVTEPTKPSVKYPESGHVFPTEFRYRGIAVEPQTGIMGMTENIVFGDGNQYGYVRFYNLVNPAAPAVVGREKLTEGYSGMPGRLAMQGDLAYVATVNAGLQIVDIKAAIAREKAGLPADGSSIIGRFDSAGLGYGEPNDIVLYGGNKAVLTTTSGNLITLDLTVAQAPVAFGLAPRTGSSLPPGGLGYLRLAVASDYVYTDANGATHTMELAIAGTKQGQIVTLNLNDPANPQYLGSAKDGANNVSVVVRDIVINKISQLAYVTTLGAIQVYDLKDPSRPRLVTNMTSVPRSGAQAGQSQVSVVDVPAIVEHNGYLFMASQLNGERVLNVDGSTGLNCLLTGCYVAGKSP